VPRLVEFAAVALAAEFLRRNRRPIFLAGKFLQRAKAGVKFLPN
jgi:hypothetical protein